VDHPVTQELSNLLGQYLRHIRFRHRLSIILSVPRGDHLTQGREKIGTAV
jgi:hypothetical protein